MLVYNKWVLKNKNVLFNKLTAFEMFFGFLIKIELYM